MRRLQPLGKDRRGESFYVMDVRDDTFIHFTNETISQQILSSGKLLENPPFSEVGIAGVQAVSLTYGVFSQNVVGNRLQKRSEKFGLPVGIVFKTSLPPKVGYIEEVIWDKDVPLIDPRIVSFEEGKTLLKRRPEKKDETSQVLYSDDKIAEIRNYLMNEQNVRAQTKEAANRVSLNYLKQAKESELSMGLDVEKEHQDAYEAIKDKLKAKMPVSKQKFYEMITKAHLREMPDYYTKLKEMESGGGDHKKKNAMDFSEINSLIQPGRTLTNRELARALRLAISAEHDAVHLYELIADTTTNIFVRRVLQDIANEEKVHSGEFEKLLSVIDVEDTQFVEEGKIEVEEMMSKPLKHL